MPLSRPSQETVLAIRATISLQFRTHAVQSYPMSSQFSQVRMKYCLHVSLERFILRGFSRRSRQLLGSLFASLTVNGFLFFFFSGKKDCLHNLIFLYFGLSSRESDSREVKRHISPAYIGCSSKRVSHAMKPSRSSGVQYHPPSARDRNTRA